MSSQGFLLFLPKRQEEILTLLSMGLSNKEIAYRTNLSDSTVREYLRKIYFKFRVKSRFELALFVRSMDKEEETLP